MKKILLILPLVLLAACNPFQAKEVSVYDAYSFATPAGFPIAAVFMTIENNTDMDDRMIGFNTNRAGNSELHTMVMEGDTMRMRGVDAYDIASGETHTLKPGGDHVMMLNMGGNVVVGETFEGTAIFENAGELPVSVIVKDRSEMNMDN